MYNFNFYLHLSYILVVRLTHFKVILSFLRVFCKTWEPDLLVMTDYCKPIVWIINFVFFYTVDLI